jgi:hypothetical protein
LLNIYSNIILTSVYLFIIFFKFPYLKVEELLYGFLLISVAIDNLSKEYWEFITGNNLPYDFYN